jgi:tetratricopeptide (TPR) repeat protein
MLHMSAHELFEKGRNLLNDNNPVGALACFEKANGMEKIPGIQSYLGLCFASERGLIREGIRLCREAIEEDRENPVHYLHLARVYIKSGDKAEALNVLRQGMTFGHSAETREMLELLGPRKKPVFPFLARKHFINKYAGLFIRIIKRR